MKYSTIQTDLTTRIAYMTEKSDYGVDRSPVFEDVIDDTVEIENLVMFDRDWSEAELRAEFGSQFADRFIGLVIENMQEV